MNGLARILLSACLLTRARGGRSTGAAPAVTRFAFAAVLFLTICVAASAGQPVPDATIVRQFYPQELAAETDPDHPVKTFQYVRADLDGTGSADYIAAVYYNGGNDVLRILRVKNGNATVACDPDVLPRLGYMPGSVEAADLDGDRRQELLLTIPGERISGTWVLQWKSGKLAVVSPATVESDGLPSTLLGGPVKIIDIDADGVPELLNMVTRGERAWSWLAYKLAGGKMAAQSSRVLLAERLVRTKGEPDEFDFQIPRENPGPFKLRIVNGDARGRNRVSAAEVDLDGRVLVPESAFKNAARVMTYDLDPGLGGALFVSLRSAPVSEMTIVVVQGE